MQSRLSQNAVEHELGGNGTRNTHSHCHGGMAGPSGSAVRLESGGASFGRTIGPLDDEFVLEHDQVTLTRRICHERLELCAEGVKEVSPARVEPFGGEKADPAQARNNAVALRFSGEVADFFDAGDEGAFFFGSVVRVLMEKRKRRKKYLSFALTAPDAF